MNVKLDYCPLSIEIKGTIYCVKALSLAKECTNCIKDELQGRDISTKHSKGTQKD